MYLRGSQTRLLEQKQYEFPIYGRVQDMKTQRRIYQQK